MVLNWLQKNCIQSISICLSLHYNVANSYLFVNCTEIIKFRANSYLFVNCTEIIKFKAKDSEILILDMIPLCLGNISKDFSVDNMKKTGLNGCLWF